MMNDIIIPLQRLLVANANILIQRRSGVEDDTVNVLKQHIKTHELIDWRLIPAMLHRTGTMPVIVKNAEKLYHDGVDETARHCCDKLKELLDWKDRPFALILLSDVKLFDFIGNRCYVFMRNLNETGVPQMRSNTVAKQEDVKPQPPTEQELLDCIGNLVGIFDNPISRRKIAGDMADEARQQANSMLRRAGRKD